MEALAKKIECQGKRSLPKSLPSSQAMSPGCIFQNLEFENQSLIRNLALTFKNYLLKKIYVFGFGCTGSFLQCVGFSLRRFLLLKYLEAQIQGT